MNIENFLTMHVVYENCDQSIIPYDAIRYFFFDGVKECVRLLNWNTLEEEEFQCRDLDTSAYPQSCMIRLRPRAGEILTDFSAQIGKIITTAERLKDCDITQIHFYSHETEPLRSLYIDYDAANENMGAPNVNQQVTIAPDGDICITIKENKPLVEIECQLLTNTATAPTKSHSTDAGFDLYSDGDYTIWNGEGIVISTGIATKIPEGWYAAVHMRSGLRFKEGLTGLSEGVIDSSYRGEWKVLVHKTFDTRAPLIIKKGDRIAQFVLHEVPKAKIVVVNSLDATERGDGGFGSTGA